MISEPLDVPVVPKQVPLYSAKDFVLNGNNLQHKYAHFSAEIADLAICGASLQDPTKRVARAVLSIGRLFSAEAQAKPRNAEPLQFYDVSESV